MEGFFQDPLENEEIYDWHQTVCEDQNCDGIHALANGVLKVSHAPPFEVVLILIE